MDLTKRKKQIITKLSKIGTILATTAIQSNVCFAEGGTGTDEVQTALTTEFIDTSRVVELIK